MSIAFTLADRLPEDVSVVGIPVYSGRVVPSDLADVEYLEQRGFEGNVGETMVVPSSGADSLTVVAVGVGKQEKVDAEVVRRAAAAFVKAVWKDTRVGFALPSGWSAQAFAEGAALERGARLAGAVALARDLINEPANDLTPQRLAEVAAEIVEREGGLELTVLDESAITAERLGGLLGVAAGSTVPPRLIELVYEPPDGAARGTVALVGKGITFDSGGLSIKPADGMETMKTDMSGAAAVLGAMSTLPAFAPPVKVIGIVPATENMPGGSAVKPGDVLRIRNGKTVEVLNTDAEGRLVLADGLSLAVEAGVDAILDLATLTGACKVALGARVAGLMGNHDGWQGQVRAAADRAGEAVWPLPLPNEYRKSIDSDIADLKNISSGRWGGALTAGLFLREFVADVPWAHLDIAGPARSDDDEGYLTKGGTGFGVRTIVEALMAFEPPSA